MAPAPYPNFRWLFRAVLVVPVVAIAALAGGVIGGYGIFAVEGALSPPPRERGAIPFNGVPADVPAANNANLPAQISRAPAPAPASAASTPARSQETSASRQPAEGTAQPPQHAHSQAAPTGPQMAATPPPAQPATAPQATASEAPAAPRLAPKHAVKRRSAIKHAAARQPRERAMNPPSSYGRALYDYDAGDGGFYGGGYARSSPDWQDGPRTQGETESLRGATRLHRFEDGARSARRTRLPPRVGQPMPLMGGVLFGGRSDDW